MNIKIKFTTKNEYQGYGMGDEGTLVGFTNASTGEPCAIIIFNNNFLIVSLNNIQTI